MRTLIFLFSLMALISCGGGGGSSTPQDSSAPAAVTQEEISLEGNVPLAATTFEVNLNLTGFTPAQEDKINDASRLIKEVIASQEFKDKILNFKHKGKRQFANNQGLSNEQIYQKILEGSEKFTPGKDNKMDLHLETYSDKKSITVGYTYKTVKEVWMNTKYLGMYPASKITTNMVHEWLHKVGFSHDMDQTKVRPFSVPYAVGYIVRDLAARI